MKRNWINTAAAFAGLAAMTLFNPARAQQPGAAAPQAAPAASSSASAVEPEAMQALNRMGAYLRTLQAFSLRSETTIDEVTDDGMKLQFGGTVTMQVRRPNGLRAELDSDRKHRQLVYDGKTMTLYGERIGYYATVPAPSTLKELNKILEEKFGIQLPLTDLFYWGTDEKALAGIKEAALIGPSKCGNAVCDHVAVREEKVDWQVWIERGKTAVPRKIVITTLSEPSQPQYVAVLTWNVAPKFDTTTFQFKPPMSAHKIPLAGS